MFSAASPFVHTNEYKHTCSYGNLKHEAWCGCNRWEKDPDEDGVVVIHEPVRQIKLCRFEFLATFRSFTFRSEFFFLFFLRL
ncbi:hypothetical protein HanPI659440_Chr03g0095511 [Helianthus annuus]|nr:hypothetical protein HanPI659440_Chr03g0095511 [Helianthus annuus]